MDTPPAKSSFLQRQVSKEDAIIQIFRPMMGNQISQALDIFDRVVSRAETLTKLGTELQVGREKFFVTPADLEANMDEYPELLALANKGRVFLDEVGYVSRTRATPITGEGTAPVGKTVDVQPITMTMPGQEPLTGAVVAAKK